MENIQGYNKLMIERCNEATRKLLENGININLVCKFIKDYQKKFIYLNECGADVKEFTFEVFWSLGKTENGFNFVA